MTVTSYPCTEADRQPLRSFMLAMRQSGAPGCWHVGDLAWSVFFLATINADLGDQVRLWKDEAQRLLGFAWFDHRDSYVGMQAWPGGDKWEIEKQMLAWADSAAGDAAPALRANALATDPEQMAFLEAHGFRREPGYVLFTRSLAGPLPPPASLKGLMVRPMAGEHEIAQRAAAHRAVFHPSRVTDVQYRRLMHMPEYCPELDMVAAAPDGLIAAFCLCWLDPVNKVGELEPVGTRPDFRCRGLGRAVVFEGLRRMQAMGMATAFVCTQHDNVAAQGLYRAAGFDPTNTDFDYVRRNGEQGRLIGSRSAELCP